MKQHNRWLLTLFPSPEPTQWPVPKLSLRARTLWGRIHLRDQAGIMTCPFRLGPNNSRSSSSELRPQSQSSEQVNNYHSVLCSGSPNSHRFKKWNLPWAKPTVYVDVFCHCTAQQIPQQKTKSFQVDFQTLRSFTAMGNAVAINGLRQPIRSRITFAGTL